MKRKGILLTAKLAVCALAAGMVLTASIGGAWAYFTANTRAIGRYIIRFDNMTHITENYSDHTKHLVVSNDGTEPVYVRAKAFSGSQYPLSYSGGGWKKLEKDGDWYYYYEKSLPGAAETSELLVKIEFPTDPEEGDECNVVVIYESIPVQYGADGKELDPWTADWSVKLNTGKTEGGKN